VTGERVDRVVPSPTALEPRNFDSRLFEEQAALFREGLALLSDAAPERRAALEELLALADFLGERLPQVLAEWRERREALRAAAKRADPKRRAEPNAAKKKVNPGRHSKKARRV
jgi:hypothetical protein